MIDIHLESPVHRPGATVEGRYLVDADTARAEVSLIWHTEGKGTEHREVVTLLEHDAGQLEASAGRRGGRFALVLPGTPTSYEGELLKVRWLVRVRRWSASGQTEVSDAALVVGSAAPPAEWRQT